MLYQNLYFDLVCLISTMMKFEMVKFKDKLLVELNDYYLIYYLN